MPSWEGRAGARPCRTNADSYEGIIDQGIIEHGCETSYGCFVADPPLISIVDDDESVREALWGLVRSVGFSVSTFASAEEFLNSDHFENADCLILDVCMPGMGGIELQRQLVAGHCDVPVIFITAHEDEGMPNRDHAPSCHRFTWISTGQICSPIRGTDHSSPFTEAAAIP